MRKDDFRAVVIISDCHLSLGKENSHPYPRPIKLSSGIEPGYCLRSQVIQRCGQGSELLLEDVEALAIRVQ